MAIGPPGWTRTTSSRVKSPACCVDTTEGSGADPGDRTRTTAIPGPQASLTSDQLWSEWRDSNPHLKAWKARGRPLPHIRSVMDRCRSPAHRHFVSCQRPRSCELVGGKGFEPNRSLRENGVTARQRTIRSYRPCWRQRQDSNPDPRALEARMLPLHHAADFTSRFEDTPSLRSGPAFLQASSQNKKGLPGDRPRRPLTP